MIVGPFPTWIHTGRYYIDATNGNDDNSGQSTSDAWKTIAKVNSESFSPDDSIFFKRGETWIGGADINWQSGIYYMLYGSGAHPIVPGDWIVGLSIVGIGEVN